MTVLQAVLQERAEGLFIQKKALFLRPIEDLPFRPRQNVVAAAGNAGVFNRRGGVREKMGENILRDEPGRDLAAVLAFEEKGRGVENCRPVEITVEIKEKPLGAAREKRCGLRRQFLPKVRRSGVDQQSSLVIQEEDAFVDGLVVELFLIDEGLEAAAQGLQG